MEQGNVGILIGSASLLVGLFSAVAAYYLWRVRRAKEQNAARGEVPPAWRDVRNPWFAPLLLPGAVIQWLLAAGLLLDAYSTGSWWEAVKAAGPLIFGCVVFAMWRSTGKTAEPGAAVDDGA